MFLFEREFDDFLCASIGEEKNGMTLSVMSAFARRNVDPWAGSSEAVAAAKGGRDRGDWTSHDCGVAAWRTGSDEPPGR